VVVGCGLGADAEFVARHGFATTAFDISATAVRTAQQRYPTSPVDYRTADLFDLVVEIINVQALPVSLRARPWRRWRAWSRRGHLAGRRERAHRAALGAPAVGLYPG
jgi:hypothetical protein